MAAVHVIPSSGHANTCEKVSTIILGKVMEKPDLILSIFAGTPAFGLYKVLVTRAKHEDINVSQVRFVVLDELIIDDEDSPFRSLLDEMLFNPLSIPEEWWAYLPPTR